MGDAAELDVKLQAQLETVAKMYEDAAGRLQACPGPADEFEVSYEARARAIRSALQALSDFQVPTVSGSEQDAIKILIGKQHYRKVRATAQEDAERVTTAVNKLVEKAKGNVAVAHEPPQPTGTESTF